MRDALFQGYAGAGFTHSSGGGLLEPVDFHGMAALLIKDRVKGSKRRQQRALQRLMDPVKSHILLFPAVPRVRSKVHIAGDIHGWCCKNCSWLKSLLVLTHQLTCIFEHTTHVQLHGALDCVPFKLFCRKDSFKELSAMAVEYGTPQFFVTFTGTFYSHFNSSILV